MGIFMRMMDGLSAAKAEPQTIMIDATYQGTPHGFQRAVKKRDTRLIGSTKGGMNTKLHTVTDQNGRPLSFFMAAGSGQ